MNGQAGASRWAGMSGRVRVWAGGCEWAGMSGCVGASGQARSEQVAPVNDVASGWASEGGDGGGSGAGIAHALGALRW